MTPLFLDEGSLQPEDPGPPLSESWDERLRERILSTRLTSELVNAIPEKMFRRLLSVLILGLGICMVVHGFRLRG
jgi:hypothetical protein